MGDYDTMDDDNFSKAFYKELIPHVHSPAAIANKIICYESANCFNVGTEKVQWIQRYSLNSLLVEQQGSS